MNISTKYMLSLIIVTTLFSAGVDAQQVINCGVNTDTILFGNILEIQYTARNVEAKFEAPDLRELPVVSGPNISTQMSFINGQKSQSMTYSYRLKPIDIGLLSIPPAYFYIQDSTYEIPPFDITILPNPEDRLQRSEDMEVIYQLDLTKEDAAIKPKKNKLGKKKRRL